MTVDLGRRPGLCQRRQVSAATARLSAGTPGGRKRQGHVGCVHTPPQGWLPDRKGRRGSRRGRGASEPPSHARPQPRVSPEGPRPQCGDPVGCLLRSGQAAGGGRSRPGRPRSLRPWKASPSCAACPERGHSGTARGSRGQEPCLLGAQQPRPRACAVLKARDERPGAEGEREERGRAPRGPWKQGWGGRPGCLSERLLLALPGLWPCGPGRAAGSLCWGPGGRKPRAWPATCPAWLQ